MFRWLRTALTSKTVAGAAVAAFGYLSDPQVYAVLPHNAAAAVTAAGVLLSVIGLRTAPGIAGTP
jgi:hypothetical protein